MDFDYAPIDEPVPYPIHAPSDDLLVSPYEWATIGTRVRTTPDGKRALVTLGTTDGNHCVVLVARDWDMSDGQMDVAPADVLSAVDKWTRSIGDQPSQITTVGALLAWSSRSGHPYQRMLWGIYNRRWVRVGIQHLVDTCQPSTELIVTVAEHNGGYAAIISYRTTLVVVMAVADDVTPGDDPMWFGKEPEQRDDLCHAQIPRPTCEVTVFAGDPNG